MIRAAGGVVLRPAGDGDVEVLLVHRVRDDDWSLPKGKREPGETDEQCAVREVEEEGAVRCRVGDELTPVAYVDRRGRPKVVRWWLMAPLQEVDFTPGDEVADRRWLPLDEAAALASYGADRDLLATVRDRLPNVALLFTSRSPEPP